MEIFSYVWLASNFFGSLLFFPIYMSGGGSWHELFNPVRIYKEIRVNVFGAIMICLFINFAMTPIALIYWIYVLFTFGRKR